MDLSDEEWEATKNLPCNKKNYILKDNTETILNELLEKRPEELNKEAKRLFEAIMQIADERDEAESELYEANNRINDLLDTIEQKKKIINLMAEQLTTPIHDKEWVIKYFEERCKDEQNYHT